MKIICVIPARLDSSRLHKKMLLQVKGKTLVQRTWESANRIREFDKVVIATDSKEIASHVKSFTNDFYLTSKNHSSGTSRMLEVFKIFERNKEFYDYWVNWQGDEPMLSQTQLSELIKSADVSHDIFTLKSNISKKKDLLDSNKVKVVSDIQNTALYFSRSVIPHYNLSEFNYQEHLPENTFFKHIGIYMFSNNSMNKLLSINQECVSFLEKYEKLEQLTFMFYGMKIKIVLAEYNGFGIDTSTDLSRFEKLLIQQKMSPSSSG